MKKITLPNRCPFLVKKLLPIIWWIFFVAGIIGVILLLTLKSEIVFIPLLIVFGNYYYFRMLILRFCGNEIIEFHRDKISHHIRYMFFQNSVNITINKSCKVNSLDLHKSGKYFSGSDIHSLYRIVINCNKKSHYIGYYLTMDESEVYSKEISDYISLKDLTVTG